MCLLRSTLGIVSSSPNLGKASMGECYGTIVSGIITSIHIARENRKLFLLYPQVRKTWLAILATSNFELCRIVENYDDMIICAVSYLLNNYLLGSEPVLILGMQQRALHETTRQRSQ